MHLPQRLALFSAMLGFTACATGVERSDMNYSIQINYGTVESVMPVKIDSNTGGGVVLGGLLGAATSGKHDQGKHAAEGALVGGLLTALTEGNRKAFSYQIAMNSGSALKIITEQGDIRQGDCVSVEQGKTSNVRRVSSTFCTDPNHVALSHPMVTSDAQSAAAQCHAAKEVALQAKTEEDLDIAVKKVQIFCGN